MIKFSDMHETKQKNTSSGLLTSLFLKFCSLHEMVALHSVQLPLIGSCRYVFWEPWLSRFSSLNHEPSISTLLLPLIYLSSNWVFHFFQTHFLLHTYPVCPFEKKKKDSPFSCHQFPLTHPQLWLLFSFPINHIPFSQMAYSSTLKMEAAGPREIFPAPFYFTRHNPHSSRGPPSQLKCSRRLNSVKINLSCSPAFQRLG